MENNRTALGLPNFSHNPIDIHSHIDHASKFDSVRDELHICKLEFLEQKYKSMGVDAVGISTFASVLKNTECICEENEYLHNLAIRNEWVYQWVVIDPRQKETYNQAKRMLKNKKVLGIKIHPDYHGYNVLDYADELFSFANEYKAVVLMHPQHILEMPKFANKYPNMKLIIAHLGEFAHIEAIKNAKHGNIYTDTSGSASAKNNIIEYAVESVGSNNILFGTDTYSFAFQFGRIALSQLSIKDKENILWKNAVRLFPKAFK